MPDRFRAWGDRWLELNPGWVLREWGDADLEWLTNRHLFDRLGASSRAAQADVARYEILLREGGLYVDTDVEPLRPLGEVLEGADLVLAEQFGGVINNAVMASVAGHEFLRDVVAGLAANAAAREDDGVLEMTGPGYLNRAFGRWSASTDAAVRDRVHVLGRDVTHPFSWYQRHLQHGPFGEAIAVHHWAVSWRRRGRRRPVGWLVRASRRGLRFVVQRTRRASRRTEAVVRSGLRRLGTVGEPEPHPRRRHVVTPLGEGRLLVHTREGVTLLLDADDVVAASSMVRNGRLDAAGVRLLRRILRPGDTYLDLGPGTGLEPLVAAWRVGVTGRSVVRCTTERARRLLEASAEANRADGMLGSLEAVPVEDWDEVCGRMVGVAEIRLVRAPAGPHQSELLSGLAPAVEDGRVRHLDVQLSDRRAAGGRVALNRLLRGFGRIPGAEVMRLDERMRPVPIDMLEAEHRSEIPHLLISFRSRAS